MARKTAIVTIDTEGRDHGKIFHIREMPARQAEDWAARALLALARSGAELPEDASKTGFMGLASRGLQALSQLAYEDLKPLMDDMFHCIMVQPDPRHSNVLRPLIDVGGDGDDIEEITTRIRLRTEVFNLHVGFSTTGVSSNSSISASTPVASPSIRTGPRTPSPRSSPPGKRR